MVSRAIYSKKLREGGFTLVEVVVGLGTSVLLLAIFMAFLVYNSKSLAALTNHLELHQHNRNALDTLTRDIRQVNRMTIYATNTVTFQDWDGLNLVFTYNPTARTLTRIKNGQSTILLQGCDQFSFTMLQRNIIEGEYDYYLADDVYTCKVVRVKWSCSRDLLGRKAQITDGQSADVVIRKQ